MTIKEQFPDISMLIREKQKSRSKFSAATLFKNIHYTPEILEQKFYDNEFRRWHLKLIAFISVLVVSMIAVFAVALGEYSFWPW
jgi:hypothetical protein